MSQNSLSEDYEFAPNVWLFRRPFQNMGLNFGTCMTAIRMPSGDLFLHSPVRLTPQTRSRLEALGQVRYVVAPNILHHLFIRDYGPEFPQARLYAMPALIEKRADIYFHSELSEGAQPEWQETINQFKFQGLREDFGETIFYHKPTKSVLVTDLIFNFPPPTGSIEKLFYLANDLGKGPAPSRLLRFAAIKDKKAARESIKKILAWEPERLILSHGISITKNATEIIERGFSWLL